SGETRGSNYGDEPERWLSTAGERDDQADRPDRSARAGAPGTGAGRRIPGWWWWRSETGLGDPSDGSHLGRRTAKSAAAGSSATVSGSSAGGDRQRATSEAGAATDPRPVDAQSRDPQVVLPLGIQR